MKELPTIIYFYLLILVSTISYGQEKSISNTYYSTTYYSGVTLVLKPDLTFTLKYRGHISSDTAAGTYKIAGDTISLNYDYNNYDTIFASYKAQNKQVPIDIQLNAGRVVLRPKTLFKKRLKLYVVDDTTGKLKQYERNGKTYLIYLQKAKL